MFAAKGLTRKAPPSKRDLAIAAGLAAVGLHVLKASSHADTRQWRCSRERSSYCRCSVPPGNTTSSSISRTGSADCSRNGRDLVVPEQGEATYYMRVQARPEWPVPVAAAGNGTAQ